MNTIRLSLFLILITAVSLSAQTRNVGARKLVLDDDNGDRNWLTSNQGSLGIDNSGIVTGLFPLTDAQVTIGTGTKTTGMHIYGNSLMQYGINVDMWTTNSSNPAIGYNVDLWGLPGVNGTGYRGNIFTTFGGNNTGLLLLQEVTHTGYARGLDVTVTSDAGSGSIHGGMLVANANPGSSASLTGTSVTADGTNTTNTVTGGILVATGGTGSDVNTGLDLTSTVSNPASDSRGIVSTVTGVGPQNHAYVGSVIGPSTALNSGFLLLLGGSTGTNINADWTNVGGGVNSTGLQQLVMGGTSLNRGGNWTITGAGTLHEGLRMSVTSSPTQNIGHNVTVSGASSFRNSGFDLLTAGSIGDNLSMSWINNGGGVNSIGLLQSVVGGSAVNRGGEWTIGGTATLHEGLRMTISGATTQNIGHNVMISGASSLRNSGFDLLLSGSTGDNISTSWINNGGGVNSVGLLQSVTGGSGLNRGGDWTINGAATLHEGLRMNISGGTTQNTGYFTSVSGASSVQNTGYIVGVGGSTNVNLGAAVSVTGGGLQSRGIDQLISGGSVFNTGGIWTVNGSGSTRNSGLETIVSGSPTANFSLFMQNFGGGSTSVGVQQSVSGGTTVNAGGVWTVFGGGTTRNVGLEMTVGGSPTNNYGLNIDASGVGSIGTRIRNAAISLDADGPIITTGNNSSFGANTAGNNVFVIQGIIDALGTSNAAALVWDQRLNGDLLVTGRALLAGGLTLGDGTGTDGILIVNGQADATVISVAADPVWDVRITGDLLVSGVQKWGGSAWMDANSATHQLVANAPFNMGTRGGNAVALMSNNTQRLVIDGSGATTFQNTSGVTMNLGTNRFTVNNTSTGTGTYAMRVSTTGLRGIEVHATQQGGGGLNNNTHFIDFYDGNGLQRGSIQGQDATDYDNDPIVSTNYDIYVANTTLSGVLIPLGIAAAAAGAQPPGFPAALAAATAGIVAGQVAQLGTMIAGYEIIDDIQKGENLGIAYTSSNGDYAEYLKRADVNEKLYPGDIVGVHNGLISKNTEGAESIYSISLAPAVLGNVPPKEEQKDYNKVGFLGQVPVKVRGIVKKGDYIIASGLNDGIGVAISPDHITAEHLPSVVGRAWSESSGMFPVGYVKISIGMGVKSTNEIVSRQQKQIDDLQKQVDDLQKQNTEVEMMRAKMDKIEQYLLAPKPEFKKISVEKN